MQLPLYKLCGMPVQVLVKELKAMHAKDASNKALIFTQYNDSLKFIGDALRGSGFAYRTISGSMPQKQRAAAIEAFQRDPPTTVFIISVRSGAVGINLTSANYVFMMEPLVNTALDDQAVGRAWRMGQKRRVTVKRLFVKHTFEEAVLKIAEDHRVRMCSCDAVLQSARRHIECTRVVHMEMC